MEDTITETIIKEAIFFKDYKRELNDIGVMKNGKRHISIGIDFDGTLVVHNYPYIGEEVPYAVDIIKEYSEKYNVLWILNTMRSGKLLDEAVNWCKNHGIELYGINRNPTQDEWESSTKAYAQFYIDDSSVGCPLIINKEHRPYVDWKAIDEYMRPILEYLNQSRI